MTVANASCFWLLKQVACVALSFAFAKAGSSIAARIAMMAMTTSNSMRVKPIRHDRRRIATWFIISKMPHPITRKQLVRGHASTMTLVIVAALLENYKYDYTKSYWRHDFRQILSLKPLAIYSN
jgi:hypothetical protein